MGREMNDTDLWEREAKFLCQSRPLAPIAPTHSAAGLVVPIPGAAHNFAYSPHLVNLVSTRKQGFQGSDFNGHGPKSPHIDGSGVLAGS